MARGLQILKQVSAGGAALHGLRQAESMLGMRELLSYWRPVWQLTASSLSYVLEVCSYLTCLLVSSEL